MRDIRRSLLIVSAATVAALTVLVPGPRATESRLAEARDGAREQLVDVSAPRVGAPTAETTVGVAAPAAPANHKVRAPAPKAAGRGDAVPDDVGDPATFVSHVDTLGTDDFFGGGEAPSDGVCPNATTCDVNQVRHQKWKTSKDGTLEIAWKFNDEGRRNLRAPAGLLEGSVRRGMAEWSRWNSNIVFTYAGTTTATFGADGRDGSCDDGTNTVTWHRFDPSVIAAVVTCMDPKTNSVRDADLALNVTQHWEHVSGEPDSRHTFDIDSIVTHELGHWLSLLDLYDSRSFRQTMMGNAVYGETRKRTLGLGDVVGLQTAYPCGKDDTCPRKGVVDD